MSPSFLMPNWCGREWTSFVPFSAKSSERRILPTGGGFYRIRIVGKDQLAYVGQTGLNLRARVASLASGTLAAEMPFNDPHTAAPKLWSFRQADGLQYEASVVACEMSKNDRMGLECYLVWQYRLEIGASPLCNFGRLHPQYITSRNRSTGMRGRKLDKITSGTTTSKSVSPLFLKGTPVDITWMGLSWTSWSPLTKAGLVGVSNGSGVYRITDERGQLIYIGPSENLLSRLRTHAKRNVWLRSVLYSVAVLEEGHTSTQLLEVENDLIGGYFANTSHAPSLQFGQSGEAWPVAE